MELPSLENPSLTVAEVAKIFDVKVATVRVWLRTEKLKGYKLPGEHWRITQAELTRFAQDMYGEN